MRDRSFAGNFIISEASSLAMPSEECSTTSCSSVSADTPNAFSLVIDYKIKAGDLEVRISELTPKQREQVFNVIEVMLRSAHNREEL